MKGARPPAPVRSRYLASGPLVWVATFVCTTLLLLAFKQALWLVVPFLMAIILYYVLFPAVRYVTLKGVDRETAAAIVAGAEAERPYGASSSMEVEADRRAAIAHAMGMAGPGDIVLIAGKGHEQGQEFARGRKVPFDDREVARDALRGLARSGTPK